MHLIIRCSTVYNSQDMKAIRIFINRAVGKDVVHVYNGLLLSPKKEQNNDMCSNVDELRDLSYWVK